MNMDTPCQCEGHLRAELQMPDRPWIPCVGHGEGCPCWEKRKKEAEEKVEVKNENK